MWLLKYGKYIGKAVFYKFIVIVTLVVRNVISIC